MAIEIAARWDRMTMQDVAAQFSAQCLGSRGNVGYLGMSRSLLKLSKRSLRIEIYAASAI